MRAIKAKKTVIAIAVSATFTAVLAAAAPVASAAEAASPQAPHRAVADLTNGFDIDVASDNVSYTVVESNLGDAESGPRVGDVISRGHNGHLELIYKFFSNTSASIRLKSSKNGSEFTVGFYLNPVRVPHIAVDGRAAAGGPLPDGTNWEAPGPRPPVIPSTRQQFIWESPADLCVSLAGCRSARPGPTTEAARRARYRWPRRPARRRQPETAAVAEIDRGMPSIPHSRPTTE